MRESFVGSPGAVSPTTAIAGTRSIAYCAALSLSRMKLTSSIVTLSERTGSSSRICRVCRHGSQSSVCVKNSRRTAPVISLNDWRSFSCSEGANKGISHYRRCSPAGGSGLRIAGLRIRGPARANYLNKSSKALRAGLGPEEPPELAAGVLVWRSTVVRGENSAHVFRASFGATRAASAALCEHSHRALVSKATHWTQLYRSTPHREQRLSAASGSDNRLPHRAHRQTSCAAIRFGVFGPAASWSRRPGARSCGGRGAAGPFGPRAFGSS